MSDQTYSDAEKDLLLRTAADAIEYGVQHHHPLAVEVELLPPVLREPGACFVTLHLHGQLRGCIGTTRAYRPLIQDVAENAFAASQRDPRFPPLDRKELPDIDLSLSILTPPEPMRFRDEADLLEQLVPGRDGLIIEDDGCHATFLPQVWEQLPDPQDFLSRLKQKAGLRPGQRSRTLAAQRYRVLHIGGGA